MKPSCLGETRPDPVGAILQTGYSQFESPVGVGGLAKQSGTRLDVLAVVARNKGRGSFREFIKQAQGEFQTVCVWEIWNPIVESALLRYGFTPETEITAWGESVSGMRWDKPS